MKFIGWLVNNLWALVAVYVVVVVMTLVIIDPAPEMLAERVVVVEESNCEGLPAGDPEPDATLESFSCYIKVSVSNLEDARNITDFEHVKLLIDGEQYVPEPEEN